MGVLYRMVRAALLGLPLVASSGCQTQNHVTRPAVARQLMQHLAQMDDSGLLPARLVEPLKAICALPSDWEPLPVSRHLLYTHQQWRSPTLATGVGVIYIRMPLPLSAGVLAHFAKNEYVKRERTGRLVAEWIDPYGRHWFEGENARYHALGYVMVSGLDAWIVYSGRRLSMPVNDGELEIARRCMETILPEGVERAAIMAQVE